MNNLPTFPDSSEWNWSIWCRIAFAACAVGGLAVVLGVAVELVRWPLLLAIIFLVTAHFTDHYYSVFRKGQSAPRSPKGQAPAKVGSDKDRSFATRLGKGVGSVAGVACGVTLAGVLLHAQHGSREHAEDAKRKSLQALAESGYGSHSSPTGNQVVSPPVPPLGVNSETYWNASVCPLYELKTFESNGKADVLHDHEKYNAELGNLIRTIEMLSTTQVAPELVAMVKRHMEHERYVLRRVKELMDSLAVHAKDKDQPSYTVQHANDLYDRMLKAWTAGELANAPENVQSLLKEFQEMEEAYERQFHEVEVMQDQLRRRFPDQEFDLPPGVYEQ